MNKFVSLPLDKLLNRENPISRIERLEGRMIYPSIRVGNLSEISPDLGEQIAGKYVIVDAATGQVLGTLSQDGIFLLADVSFLSNARGYKFEDVDGENAGGLYCYVDSSDNTTLRLRVHGQNGSQISRTYVDAVAGATAEAILTADSGGTTDGVPMFKVAQTTDSYAELIDCSYIDFHGAEFRNAPRFLPFGVYLDLGPFSASNKYPYSVAIDRNLTLVQFAAAFSVETTNDGSNYWNIHLHEWASDTLLATLTTSAASAGTKTVVTTTTFNDSTMTTSNKGLYIKIEKVNSPGNLYLFGPTLEVTV